MDKRKRDWRGVILLISCALLGGAIETDLRDPLLAAAVRRLGTPLFVASWLGLMVWMLTRMAKPSRLTTIEPGRQSFRFTLRTFFIVLTLFGVWLGVSLNWIKDRQEARTWLSENTSHFWSGGDWPPAPLILRVLGEPGVYSISVSPGQTYSRDQLQRLFPEASVEEDRSQRVEEDRSEPVEKLRLSTDAADLFG